MARLRHCWSSDSTRSRCASRGEIHYSGVVHQRFPGRNDPLDFDLRHSARLLFERYSTAYDFYFSVARAAVSGQFRGYPGSFRRYVSRLSAGIPVSQGAFIGTPQSREGLLGTCYGRAGLWNTNDGWPQRIGFIGFRFDNGSGQQYGWVRLRVEPNHACFFNVVVLDYAWGEPGDPILTGQRSSSGEMVDATSLDGSLGLLALGVVGLDAWRKGPAKSQP